MRAGYFKGVLLSDLLTFTLCLKMCPRHRIKGIYIQEYRFKKKLLLKKP